MSDRTPDQQVADAQRITAFLADEAISSAFSRMERRFYEEFLVAESAEQRVRAWAKAHVLRGFELELRTITDAGEVAVLTAAKAHASRTTRS